MLGPVGTIVVVVGLAGAAPAGSPALQILRKERCQTDLPVVTDLGSPRASRVSRPTGVEPAGGTIALPPPSSRLVLVGVAIVVAVALAFALRRLPARDHPRPPEPAPAASVREAPGLAAPAHDPDGLARQGRFAEAIHALLLRAIDELDAGRARPALTSRELLRRSRLGRDARDALGALVTAVEWGHFGAKPVGLADYEASLAAYRRLRTAWRAPR
jgi:hypothetical protein